MIPLAPNNYLTSESIHLDWSTGHLTPLEYWNALVWHIEWWNVEDEFSRLPPDVQEIFLEMANWSLNDPNLPFQAKKVCKMMKWKRWQELSCQTVSSIEVGDLMYQRTHDWYLITFIKQQELDRETKRLTLELSLFDLQKATMTGGFFSAPGRFMFFRNNQRIEVV